jgi:putative membrane protein insertion efficiency factor
MSAVDPSGPPAPTIPQRVATALIRGYQLAFSPMFAGSCRFHPSCSAYAAEAIARFGVLKGSLLAVRRLARCRPLAAYGFDPVPPRPAAGVRTAAGAGVSSSLDLSHD